MTTNQKAGSSNLSGRAIFPEKYAKEIPRYARDFGLRLRSGQALQAPARLRLAHACKTAQVRISQGAPLYFERIARAQGASLNQSFAAFGFWQWDKGAPVEPGGYKAPVLMSISEVRQSLGADVSMAPGRNAAQVIFADLGVDVQEGCLTGVCGVGRALVQILGEGNVARCLRCILSRWRKRRLLYGH